MNRDRRFVWMPRIQSHTGSLSIRAFSHHDCKMRRRHALHIMCASGFEPRPLPELRVWTGDTTQKQVLTAHAPSPVTATFSPTGPRPLTSLGSPGNHLFNRITQPYKQRPRWFPGTPPHSCATLTPNSVFPRSSMPEASECDRLIAVSYHNTHYNAESNLIQTMRPELEFLV